MVEVLIAMGVLLVAVMGAVSSQITSMGLMQVSEETSLAMSDLRAAMEEILAAPIDDIPVPGSAYEAGQPIAAFEGLHLQDERIVPAYPGYVAGADVPDPLSIVLTISWNDYGGRPRAMQLSSMKTR